MLTAQKVSLSDVTGMLRSASARQEALKSELLAGIRDMFCERGGLSIPQPARPRPEQLTAIADSQLEPESLDLDGTPKLMSAHLEGELQEGVKSMNSCVRTNTTPGSGMTKTASRQSTVLQAIVKGGHPIDFEEQELSRTMVLKNIVTSSKFEVAFAFLIVANAFTMVFDAQYAGLQVGFELQWPGCKAEARDVWPAAAIVLVCCDSFFGAVFLLEAAFKMVCLRSEYFSSAWNWFDLICVFAFVVDKLAQGVLPIDAELLRLLRLFRLARLVRVLRSLELLDALYIIATAIKGLGRMLFWAMLLLAVMLMACALCLTQVLHASYFAKSGSSLSPEELAAQLKMYEYFGTFTRCYLSMFEITLGNFPPVTRLLVENVSEWFTLFGVFHKLSIGFAVIGVMNGLIMQETFKVAATDDVIMVRQRRMQQEVVRKKMTTLFEALDSSGDGDLDFGEFAIVAEDPEVKIWLASMDIETDDLQTLFALLDSDNSGTVSIDELVTRIPRIRGAARSIDTMALRNKFNQVTEQLSILAQRVEPGGLPRLDSVVALGGVYEGTPNLHTQAGIDSVGGKVACSGGALC